MTILSRVCIVNGYVGTCQHSQRLQKHAIFENVKLIFCYFQHQFFIFIIKIIYCLSAQSTTPCQCSRQLCGRRVSVVHGTTTLAWCQPSQRLPNTGVSQISSQRRKISRNCLCLFIHTGPRQSFFYLKKGSKIS